MHDSDGNLPTDALSAQLPGAHAARLLEQLLQIARSSALEEMASGIAHELNQPIGAITTFAQAGSRMLNRPEPMVAPAAEVLQHISKEALNAGQGIRRIRALFTGQDGERVNDEMIEVIAELMPVLELLAQRRGAQLELQAQRDLPPVSVDRLRIQHVLFTLVENALEAPPQDGSVALVNVRLSGDRYGVQVTVTDRGPGVPPDVKQHLFRPFFTTKPRGTGLGLASSRAIIEAHEGAIGFVSTPGSGASFWFRLPALA